MAVRARKFRIEDAHVKPIAKADPGLAKTLPPVGYVVHPARNRNKMTLYSVDGFQVGLLTEVATGSELLQIGKALALKIGTDFSTVKSDTAYTNALRKKGKNGHYKRNALLSTRLHHEAIHARIVIDLERARTKNITFEEMSEVTRTYFMFLLKYYNADEGRALRKTVEEAVLHVGGSINLSEQEIEKLLNEKYAFDRVSFLTPDFHVPSAEIVTAYHERFYISLRRTRGFLKLATNNFFVSEFKRKANAVQKALTALYARIDADAAAAAAQQTP